nr:SRPBCC family protein [Kribbella shirazensis]
MRRSYQADPAEVWDALTDPERMRRWFLPVSGDLKVGGSFQLEGNAGGEILECDPPKRFKVTFGGPTSLLELRLLPGTGSSTDLELEHSMSEAPAPGGSGALWVGPGWDGALLGLALYVSGELPEDTDPVKMADSPEVIAFNEQSVRAWIEDIRASGTTTEEDLLSAAKISLSQYAPDAEL